MKVLSLFSGCGGFDLGAKEAGFELELAIDNDPVAILTLKNNLGCNAKVADVTRLSCLDLPRADLLIGGPPCQGFSSAGPKAKDDLRNKLWTAYLEVLIKKKPRAFIIENVPGFERELPDLLSTIQDRIPNLYHIESKKLISQYHGVPQFRHRLFVVGIRGIAKNTNIWPKPTTEEIFSYTRPFEGMRTLKEAIQDLGPAAPYTKDLYEDEKDHFYVPLNAYDYGIASQIPNGGSLKDIPDDKLPSPYKGRKRGPKGWTWYFRKPRLDLPARSIIANIRPNYSTILAPDMEYFLKGKSWFVNGIDKKNYMSSTGHYVSPVEQRRFTVRECARIQSFPDNFIFSGNPLDKHRMIGNAVPVELAKRLCKKILSLL